jgi:PAS domain S-box-containing protein
MLNTLKYQIYIVSPEYDFIWVNPAFEEAIGLTLKELKGKKCYQVLHQADKPPEMCLLRQMLKDNEFKLMETEIEINGKSLHVSATPVLDDQGRLEKVIHILTDITEHKKVQEAFKESQEHTRIVSELLSDYSFRVDVDALGQVRLSYVSENFPAITGRDINDARTFESWLSIIYPDDVKPAANFLQNVISTGKQGEIEFRTYVKQNLMRWVHVYVKPIRDGENGRVITLIGAVKDITERKKSETALQESESRFRYIFDQSIIAAAMVSLDGHFMSVNEAFCRMLGYAQQELTSMHFTDITHSDDRAESIKQVQRLSRGEINQYVTDKKYIHKDGSVIWGHLSVGMVNDSDGSPICFLPMIEDITERKKMQEMLAESEEKYRIMVENSSDLIWTLDVEGRLTFVNKRALNIGGYLMPELDKKHFSMGVYPDDLDKVKTHVARVLKGESQSYEVRIVDRHDRILVLQVNATPQYRNKQVVGVVSFARDITESKQAEVALQESEEKFRGLAEQSPNMIFINLKGRIIYANKKCEEIMGYSRKEFYSEKFDFMDIIAPDSRKLIKGNLKKHLKGKEIPPYEYKLLTKDGKEIVGIHTTKLIDIKGDVAVLGIITDITEHVRSREQIQSQAVSLEQKNAALRELLNQITVEKKELENRMHQTLDKLVMPKIKRMRSRAEDDMKDQLGVIESAIKNIASTFGKKISSSQRALSSREIEVCDMIRNGLKNKAIARSLRLSLETIETMRKTIRRKLKIQNKQVNLKTYLQTI